MYELISFGRNTCTCMIGLWTVHYVYEEMVRIYESDIHYNNIVGCSDFCSFLLSCWFFCNLANIKINFSNLLQPNKEEKQHQSTVHRWYHGLWCIWVHDVWIRIHFFIFFFFFFTICHISYRRYIQYILVMISCVKEYAVLWLVYVIQPHLAIYQQYRQ